MHRDICFCGGAAASAHTGLHWDTIAQMGYAMHIEGILDGLHQLHRTSESCRWRHPAGKGVQIVIVTNLLKKEA